MEYQEKVKIGGIAAGIVAILFIAVWLLRPQPFSALPVDLSGARYDRAAVTSVLRTAGVDVSSTDFGDQDYELPSVYWASRTFPFEFEKFRRKLGVYFYEKGANDCDKAASLARAFAHVLHYRTSKRIDGAALPVAEVWFATGPGRGHAVCLFVAAGPQGPAVVWFDPQKGVLPSSPVISTSIPTIRF
jgi:hypothetical protein